MSATAPTSPRYHTSFMLRAAVVRIAGIALRVLYAHGHQAADDLVTLRFGAGGEHVGDHLVVAAHRGRAVASRSATVDVGIRETAGQRLAHVVAGVDGAVAAVGEQQEEAEHTSHDYSFPRI